MAKLSPLDMLNKVREKAKLDETTDFSKSVAIRLKAGKIKFQLLAKDSEHLFRPRTQHLIPTIPHEDDKNEKWLIADCKGQGCPICTAVTAFKQSGVSLDEVNEEYNPKYEYKNLKSVFTQPEHYLLCAKILADQADDGTYLPKDAELGSTHLIQFTRTALNNLMSAYEDFIDDNEDEEVPPLFAIFDDEDTAKSLTITCRVTNQPYSCTFSFNKTADVNTSDVDEDKIKLLEEVPEVPEDHYNKCVKRIKQIQNYFVKPKESMDNVTFVGGDSKDVTTDSKSSDVIDDFDINEFLNS